MEIYTKIGFTIIAWLVAMVFLALTIDRDESGSYALVGWSLIFSLAIFLILS